MQPQTQGPLLLRPTGQLAGWVALWLLLTAWLRPLALPDEGRYVGVAWEMLRSGDGVVPTLDGLPYFHKPPLFYWITAAAMKLAGPWPLAARAAPLLAGIAGALALHAFMRRWVGAAAASAALVALLLQPLWYLGSQYANMDMLVAGCITVCVLAAAHAVKLAEQTVDAAHPSRPRLHVWLALAWLAAAAGWLAKGLIGFVLPSATLLLWLAWRSLRPAASMPRPPFWRHVLRLILTPGLPVALLLALAWPLAVQQRIPGFLHYFIVVQHVERFAAGGFNNVQPFWFYAVLLALATLPWWIAMALARRGHAGRAAVAKAAPAMDTGAGADAGDLAGLFVAWVVVVAGFFTLPASKLVGYILPAVPPLMGWLALRMLPQAVTPQGRIRRLWWIVGACAWLLGAVILVTATVRVPKSTAPLAQVLQTGHRAGEPVIAFGDYPFDLQVLAGLREPIIAVGDWADPMIKQQDNWRRELVDAAEFAPALGRQVLVDEATARQRVCEAPGTVWIVAPKAMAPAGGLLTGEPLATTPERGLWRLTAKPAVCGPRTPSAG